MATASLAFEDARGFEASTLRAAAFAAAGFTAAALVAKGALLSVAAAALLAPLLAALGAGGALLLGQAQRRRAREAGDAVPSRGRLALAGLLGALAGLCAARGLPQLWMALAALASALPLLSLLPPFLLSALSAALCGAAFGLWLGAALLPLHLAAKAQAVERRLRALRFAPGMTAELRALCERAAQAFRGADAALLAHREAWGEGAPPLRTTLEKLALAALEQCGRAAALSSQGAPAVEESLERQRQAAQQAEAARDPQARASLERAAKAHERAAERAARLVLARERLSARAHELAAALEEARLSLTLLMGVRAERMASEVGFLDERLKEGCHLADTEAGELSSTPPLDSEAVDG
jgi:hypothetical protein